VSLNELFQRLDLTVPFSWKGCPAIDACLHQRDDGHPVPLCRACSKASARREKLRRAK
jgi:hypothetical protein